MRSPVSIPTFYDGRATDLQLNIIYPGFEYWCRYFPVNNWLSTQRTFNICFRWCFFLFCLDTTWNWLYNVRSKLTSWDVATNLFRGISNRSFKAELLGGVGGGIVFCWVPLKATKLCKVVLVPTHTNHITKVSPFHERFVIHVDTAKRRTCCKCKNI